MTRASPATPYRAIVNAFVALEAPAGAPRALVVGAARFSRHIERALAPAELETWAPFDSAKGSDAEQRLSASRESFDLIAVVGLEAGSIEAVFKRLEVITGALNSSGVAALWIETFAAPNAPTDAFGPVGLYDAVLFPHSAASGDLGPTLERRGMLSASSWRLLIQQAGLEIVSIGVTGDQPMPPEFLQEHAGRLSVFDARELASGRLTVLARRREVLA